MQIKISFKSKNPLDQYDILKNLRISLLHELDAGWGFCKITLVNNSYVPSLLGTIERKLRIFIK